MQGAVLRSGVCTLSRDIADPDRSLERLWPHLNKSRVGVLGHDNEQTGPRRHVVRIRRSLDITAGPVAHSPADMPRRLWRPAAGQQQPMRLNCRASARAFANS